MNILHIYKDYPPIMGGIENHLQLLAEGQARRGHTVTALVTHPDAKRTTYTTENGVRVVRARRLATVASTPLSASLAVQRWRERPDVVHLHFPYPVGEMSQWALGRGAPGVLTYHSDVVRQASILRFYKPLMMRALDATQAIIIGSPPMRQSAYLASYQDKLHFIPYGIALSRFMARPSDSEMARVRYRYLSVLAAVPNPLPLLLFVGRLRYYKGLDTLITALPRIRARLVVAGSGPMQDAWQDLAALLSVSDRVSWLGDVPDADLAALYHLADLFVLPASHPSEAFGLVQVEAMAAGLPVICTELGTGTTYVNRDGETGLVVPPREPLALADAIGRLLADAGLRIGMGDAARLRAREFDVETMVDRTLALYEEVSEGRRR
jgi:rhamnosyl/mannosyltransferase